MCEVREEEIDIVDFLEWCGKQIANEQNNK